MTHAAKRALVADDDEATGRLLREALAREGYQAELRRDGREALERLLEGPPVDLVVLDVLMPGLTGVDVLRALRERGRDVPVVVMSSFLSEEVRRACRSLGRVGLLKKPFGVADLRRAVSQAVRRVPC